MKIEYIRINSISEINIKKIPLGSIHLYRYIDNDNNRFAIRFNKKSHKIEIHRILNKSELTKHQTLPEPLSPESKHKDIIIEKKKRVGKKSDLLDENSDLNIFDSEEDDEPETPNENYKQHAEIELKKLKNIKSRILHIINNLDKSKIYDNSSAERNIISDLNREIDMEIFQKMDQAEKTFNELTLYPRPISYYITKYEKTRHAELKNIDSNIEKMNRMIKWEMETIFYELFEQINLKVITLLQKENLKNEEQISRLAHQNQQIFRDAKSATILCYKEISAMISLNDKWIKIDE